MIAEDGEKSGKLQGLNQTLMSIENGLLRRGLDREKQKYNDLVDFVADGGELKVASDEDDGEADAEADDDAWSASGEGEEEGDDE